MGVKVTPPASITVRVGGQNQSQVASSTQFVGAPGQQAELDAAYATANQALIEANTALTQSNTALVLAQNAYNTANAAASNQTVLAAFNQANSANILAQSAYNQANSGTILAQAAFNSANNVAPQIQPAFNQANAAFNQANTASSNTIYLQGVDASQNANISAAFTQANSAGSNTVYITGGLNTANANIAYIFGVELSSNAYAQAAYAQANTANNLAQSAYNKANNIVVVGNTIPLGTNTTGLLVSNAVTLTTSTTVTDSLAKLNQILGKLVPNAPATFPSTFGTLTITGTVGPYRMTNFTQTDNTGTGTASVAGGTSVAPLRVATYTTSTITNINTITGDTISVIKNAVQSGTRTITAGATNAGTYSDLVIINNVDYSTITGIAANFWYSANLRASGTGTAGWNNVSITDTNGSPTSNATWYYDNSAPGVPTFVTPSIVPLSPSLTYSSTVPHYNSSSTFRLGVVVSKLSGDMYPASDTFFTGTAGGAFGAPASNTYTAVGITTPLARNLYVASGSATVNTTSTIIAGFGSSATGPSVTVDNSYSTASQVFTTALANTVLYKTGTASAMEETGFTASSFGTAVGSGNAVRVINFDLGTSANDTPVFAAGSTAFNSQTGTFYASDATVVAGVLKNDTTNYSTGYLPVGPNLTTQNAAQYITLKMTRSSVSKFSINYTTATGIGGIWCAMPAQTSYATGNNWYSMTVDNSLAGGCALGGNLVPASTGAKVYNCQFAGLNSSNATNNEILVRIRLNAGQSITALSFAASTV